MENMNFAKIEILTKEDVQHQLAIAKEIKENDPIDLIPNFITTNAVYVIGIDIESKDT